jgi:hypothetical protein
MAGVYSKKADFKNKPCEHTQQLEDWATARESQLGVLVLEGTPEEQEQARDILRQYTE